MSRPESVRLRLPATSANLGSGFDAVGLALSLWLEIEAHAAGQDRIEATGRDAAVCGRLDGNLILASYHATLHSAGVSGPALALRVHNEIPLGMGCGSSAAARLAGVALANSYGALGWTESEVVSRATVLEGHPDNIAACWFGGFTVSVPERNTVAATTFPLDGAWQLLLAVPPSGLATEKARSVLPDSYSREDLVFNVQRAALLTAAFAQERLDLLRLAMQDRIHQPYRLSVCALLQSLDLLSAAKEFAGVALSGAGPALLAVLAERTTLHAAEARLRASLGPEVELVPVRVAGPATVEVIA